METEDIKKPPLAVANWRGGFFTRVVVLAGGQLTPAELS
jgi:hypothetical protein